MGWSKPATSEVEETVSLRRAPAGKTTPSLAR
jgi:hypothetical protein